MKMMTGNKLAGILFSIIFLSAGDAMAQGFKRGPDIQIPSAFNSSFESPSMRDPKRKINGTVESTMGKDWVNFSGKVERVWSDGVEVQGWFKSTLGGYSGRFFVLHFPYPVGDGDPLHEVFRAKLAGSRILSVKGSSYERTVRQIDYGQVTDPNDKSDAAPLTPEQIAAAKAAASKKKSAASAATLKFYQENADKGDDQAQLRLGKIYLDGKYCERDVEKAKQMFTKAAAQGNREAAAELVKLKAEK